MTSIDDIDPNVCNWVHNLTACESDSALVARERLAELTGADVARIYVLDVEIALWPDASLGVRSRTRCTRRWRRRVTW